MTNILGFSCDQIIFDIEFKCGITNGFGLEQSAHAGVLDLRVRPRALNICLFFPSTTDNHKRSVP